MQKFKSVGAALRQHVALARGQEHRQVKVEATDFLSEIDAAHAWHHHIGDTTSNRSTSRASLAGRPVSMHSCVERCWARGHRFPAGGFVSRPWSKGISALRRMFVVTPYPEDTHGRRAAQSRRASISK